jgi:hypothetical protein
VQQSLCFYQSVSSALSALLAVLAEPNKFFKNEDSPMLFLFD